MCMSESSEAIVYILTRFDCEVCGHVNDIDKTPKIDDKLKCTACDRVHIVIEIMENEY